MARNVFKKLAALLFICAVILLVIKQMTFAEKKPEKSRNPKPAMWKSNKRIMTNS